MEFVPLKSIANQSANVVLGDQNCTVDIYQTAFGMFIDLYANDALVIGGVPCWNANRIVRSLYLGFSGDLIFVDTQGNDDPVYAGLGSRFQLAYLSPADLGTLGLVA